MTEVVARGCGLRQVKRVVRTNFLQRFLLVSGNLWRPRREFENERKQKSREESDLLPILRVLVTCSVIEAAVISSLGISLSLLSLLMLLLALALGTRRRVAAEPIGTVEATLVMLRGLDTRTALGKLTCASLARTSTDARVDVLVYADVWCVRLIAVLGRSGVSTLTDRRSGRRSGVLAHAHEPLQTLAVELLAVVRRRKTTDVLTMLVLMLAVLVSVSRIIVRRRCVLATIQTLSIRVRLRLDVTRAFPSSG